MASSTEGSQGPEKSENLSEYAHLEGQEPAFGHLSVLKPICLAQSSAVRALPHPLVGKTIPG